MLQFRGVDLHTYAHSVDFQILNLMEVRGGCWIERQASLTNSMANIMGARRQNFKLLGHWIADNIAVSISPKAPA